MKHDGHSPGAGRRTACRRQVDGPRMVALALADADHCEVGRWASRALARWVRASGDLTLHECLGLPRSPRALARAQRDHWLRVAAGRLGRDGSCWARACRLLSMARSAARARAPSTGDLALAAVLRAARACPLPTTARQLRNILRVGDREAES